MMMIVVIIKLMIVGHNDNVGTTLLGFAALFLCMWCKLNSVRFSLTVYMGEGVMKLDLSQEGKEGSIN